MKLTVLKISITPSNFDLRKISIGYLFLGEHLIQLKLHGHADGMESEGNLEEGVSSTTSQGLNGHDGSGLAGGS